VEPGCARARTRRRAPDPLPSARASRHPEPTAARSVGSRRISWPPPWGATLPRGTGDGNRARPAGVLGSATVTRGGSVANALDALLVELEQFGRTNDDSHSERPPRMLHITRDTGELLSVLVRATVARRVLEIGTSNGYSTL